MRKIMIVLGVLFMECTEKIDMMEKHLVKEVDLERYAGTWFEISRIPVRQEKDLHNVTATYEIKEDGKISVLNAGINEKKELKSSTALAWQPDVQTPGKLIVQFFWPFIANYLILYVDENYSSAIVSSSGGKYAWILSKISTIPEADYHGLIQIAHDKGIDTTRFERVMQKW